MRFGCLIACWFTPFLFALAAPAEDAHGLPVSSVTLELDFKSVRLVKLVVDAEEPTIEIISAKTGDAREQKFKTELRTRTIPTVHLQQVTRTRLVPVTTIREEKRTRKVTIDGKQVEQEYTVKIPVTGQKAQTDTVAEPIVVNLQESYEVQVPITPADQNDAQQPADLKAAAKQSSKIRLADISAWDVEGDEIGGDELAARLLRPTAVFLLGRPIDAGVKLQPSHLAVLREDTLFLYVRPGDQDPTAENPAAP